MKRSTVYGLVDIERARQVELHGDHTPADPDMPDWLKYLILAEEVGEVARAMLERGSEGLEAELVQVAAVAVAWLEALD